MDILSNGLLLLKHSAVLIITISNKPEGNKVKYYLNTDASDKCMSLALLLLKIRQETSIWTVSRQRFRNKIVKTWPGEEKYRLI